MASPQLVVDTDIIVDYLRRRADTLRTAQSRFSCAMTAITLYELKAVGIRSERQERTIAILAKALGVLPFGPKEAEQAAEIWRLLARKGELIGLPDTLIAGICLANGLPLLTRNPDHYKRVPGLEVLAPSEILT
jgi:tRNA(fMet)-specific endonuclease VapC